MCDSCLDSSLDAQKAQWRQDDRGEARKRRLAYADLQITNEHNIHAAMQQVSSPTAKLLAKYIGQEIAVNLPESAGFVAAPLQSVNNDYFTVLIGNGLISHHPLLKIMQILESQDGSGVPFLKQFFPIVIILEQHTKVPTSFSSVGVSVPIG